MVYCDSCGKQNRVDAEYCSKCGNPLKGGKQGRSRDYRQRQRDECFGIFNDDRDRWHRQRNECFGLPHGNIIGPLIIGAILILLGISSFYGVEIWNYIGPIVIVIIGILIIAGALYKTRRRH